MRIAVRHRMPGRARVAAGMPHANEGCLKRAGRWLENREEVRAVRVNGLCHSLVIDFEPGVAPAGEEAVLSALESLDPEAIEDETSTRDSAGEQGAEASVPTLPGRFAIATASLLASFAGGPATVIAGAATVYSAWPTYTNALEVWRRERRLNVDVLDGLAMALALVRGQVITAALIAWMLRLGDAIRDRTAASSHRAISNLLEFQSQRCWLLREGVKVEVFVRELTVGDTIVVYAGSVLPVDGQVLKGVASLDQRAITGESLPVVAQRGTSVYAGTSIQEGHVYIRATAVGADTTVARIVETVERTAVGETRIQNYAEKLADRLVAPTLSASFGLFALSGNLERLISMLIVDYGTGIRIAAPTAILASITDAARRGVLIKSGSAVEKLSAVDAMIFDKTGTLTRGIPRIHDVLSYAPGSLTSRELLALVAAAEVRHKHPVAQAVLDRARAEHVTFPSRDEGARFRIGRGVEARVNGYEVWIGSERFLAEKAVSLQHARADLRRFNAEGCSTLLVAVDGELVGALPYSDEIRPEMSSVLQELHARGIREVAMVTGDNASVASAVAHRLGFDRFFADVLPEDKVEYVEELRSSGRSVAMVGDGVNDAAALVRADIGIAVKNGTDLTRQVAHVVIMQDSMWKLITALDVARDAMRLVRQNFAIVAGLNTLAMALAIPTGWVHPGLTALISNGSAILATANAMRPAFKYL